MTLKLDMSKIELTEIYPICHVQIRFCYQIDKSCNELYHSSFLVLVNGKPGKSFKRQRGLRQRCQISPYIFFLCAKTLCA